MNILSKLVLVLLTGLAGAVLLLFVRMERNSKAQQEMHEALLEKIAQSRAQNMDTDPDKKPEPEQQQLYGLDISHWNGDIVNEIPSIDHISFLICKATQGSKGIDPDFESNWALIREKGSMRGAYHFYLYTDNPVEQATHFCNTVGPLEETDFPLVLDIEELSLPRGSVDKQKLQEDISLFLTEVERRTKRKPIIYSDYAFANQYLDNEQYAAYPLWLADYTDAPAPRIPETWKHTGYLIWQKSNKYNINSIKTDFDIFQGDKEDLYLN